MKVKTFTIIFALLFLLALVAIVQFPQYFKPYPLTVAVTEEPNMSYSASMTPELPPDMAVPEINETTVSLAPVTLSENNNKIKPITTPTPAPMTPTPTVEPCPTPMAPMKPMEPWKPAAPMTPW